MHWTYTSGSPTTKFVQEGDSSAVLWMQKSSIAVRMQTASPPEDLQKVISSSWFLQTSMMSLWRRLQSLLTAERWAIHLRADVSKDPLSAKCSSTRSWTTSSQDRRTAPKYMQASGCSIRLVTPELWCDTTHLMHESIYGINESPIWYADLWIESPISNTLSCELNPLSADRGDVPFTRLCYHFSIIDPAHMCSNTYPQTCPPIIGVLDGSKACKQESRKQHHDLICLIGYRLLRTVWIFRVQSVKIACAGGKRSGEEGFFVEPTVFAGVEDHFRIAKEVSCSIILIIGIPGDDVSICSCCPWWAVVCHKSASIGSRSWLFIVQEIFGPVQSIMKFKSLDEIIKRANDTK